ncbi:hypothetical protein [Flavobacterium sp. 3HN19-14]|uniref:hypothetical protein n=1 Tax=Flavobacterium sp. 3HN19-14 TaxID=3448133 RepID=UPI003EDF378F
MTGIGNLPDGNYEITYNLAGANEATAQLITISVISGIATFTIPATMLSNSGGTAIIITNVLDLQTGCSKAANKSKNFIINPPPATDLDISVANSCANQPASVLISGMGQINSVSVTYDLSGANVATGQTAVFSGQVRSRSFCDSRCVALQ